MKINIVKPVLPSIKNIANSFSKALSSGLVTNNSQNVNSFEKNLKKHFKSKYKPIVFCNGQMALFSLIQAWKFYLEIRHTEKVYCLIPSFTWSGTINCLILNNITPIFCDIDNSFLLDLKNLNNEIKKIKIRKNKIKFIIPVSNYGNIVNIEYLKTFCKKNNLIPLLDSAPAFGSKYKGAYPNNFGIDEIYSFHATKIMSSMEGGCAVTNNKKIHKYLTYLRDFGQFEKKIGNIKLPGLNSKMQEISAIVGNHNLKNFSKILKTRFNIIKKYEVFFNKFEKKKIFTLMNVDNNVTCCYLYFPIIVNKKILKFQNYLKKNNISFRRYYTSTHDLEFYKKNRYLTKKTNLKFTEKIKNKIISLPLYSNMNSLEMNYLFNKIEKFYKLN